MLMRTHLILLSLFALLNTSCEAQSPRPAPNTQPPARFVPGAPDPRPSKDAVAALTRNFYFIFDGSGSMGDPCSAGGTKKIVTAKQAVIDFISVVPTNVNLGLVVFDGRGVNEVVALGPNNREQFLNAIRQVREGSGTPLNASIKFGIDRLADQREKQLNYGEFRLITVTDGEAGDGSVSVCGQYAITRKIPIYTIGLCLGKQHELRKYSLSYQDANNAAELKKALEETVGESDSLGN